MPARPLVALTLSGLLLLSAWPALALHVEQRDEVSYLRGWYNFAFFERHHDSYQVSAAIHFAHGIQHDILALTPIDEHAKTDAETDADYLNMLYDPPRTEPTMELFGPYTAQFAWRLLRSIDWTHMHHEQTYDILSDDDIKWNDKEEWTDRAVAYYLEKLDLPMSCAPLDVTMRRAAHEAIFHALPELLSPVEQLLLCRSLVAPGHLRGAHARGQWPGPAGHARPDQQDLL